MELAINDIKKITYGVDRCEKTADAIILHRFSAEQEELYKTDAPDLYKKVFATAGVSLRFITNSKTLKLKVNVNPGSSRTYFSHDVFVNGKYLDSLKNFGKEIENENYPVMNFPLGNFEKIF